MSSSRLTHIYADLSLLGICVIWGTSFAIVKTAVMTADPAAFIAARFITATLLITAFSAPRIPRMTWPIFKAGFALSIPLFLGFYLQTLGLSDTTASKAGFITGMHVAFTPFLAWLMLGKRVRVYAALGVATAIIGLAMLSLGGSFVPALGDLLVLGCALAFALHIVLLGKYSPVHDCTLLTLAQMIWVTIIASAFAGRALHGFMSYGRDVIASAVYLGATGTALAYLVQTTAQRHTPPTRAALIFQMEPVFAALFAWILLSETMSLPQWAGATLIFLGVLICQIGDFRAEKGRCGIEDASQRA